MSEVLIPKKKYGFYKKKKGKKRYKKCEMHEQSLKFEK